LNPKPAGHPKYQKTRIRA